MPRQNAPGSGTLATDFYRERSAHGAMQVLSAGQSITCRSGDHAAAGELCTETIRRLGADTSKHVGSALETAASAVAIDKLRNGFGHHLAQGAHSGSNTCAQVLAAATT